MKHEKVIAAVAIGSNLSQPYYNLLTAENHLLALRESTNFRFSPIYKTAPIDSTGAPDYLNAVVVFETSLTPVVLLTELLSIETLNGRKRSFVNAPRTLDLDLLLYGDKIISTENLIVPHPRFHKRFFVLTPLNDLLPETQHPLLKASINELEQRLQTLYEKEKYISHFDQTFRSVSTNIH
ncbi:2-amino-4-hydroxy-6-hydroxymethyldihydropteridine diphosphokinase [Photorhabdus laumondii]|uniref:2-amino-4-hydroxy-6-hydroxymethyldihydropteridine pyrophosphokinase n=1 Tax=Photorhabdus laumondii subsp. clarkei TaxID=2029685 RepID=A0A329VAG2_9GAMM|nr:2-amino-4-hydroxy-6-hydroxymethyldihydropteridine diphosphokinase [Photorhabdus laumondii]PQQ39570.1 2-amino-4-hydroxy-6-hydroxymethyldihydropteridine diphosphokinase [Photorhabdus luminescens]RAW84809.1 2-amino-4-hydroxy-6-hydroxymethyldihydropteridine diphosphokinase [Photorhabdus laumondii subsp. clarkei]